jgi:hypothetical protein
MNQLELLYIHTSKGHKETPWAAILNKKKKMSFFFSLTKSKNKRAEQIFPGRLFV